MSGNIEELFAIIHDTSAIELLQRFNYISKKRNFDGKNDTAYRHLQIRLQFNRLSRVRIFVTSEK